MNSRRRELRIVALWLATGLIGSALSAQRFGQWWWDGSLSAGQRNTENLRSGEKLSSFDQQELRGSFGLNGFLLHPALGQFRLGLDLASTELDGGRSRTIDRTGFSANVSLLPRGSYPFSFSYRRQLYDYAQSDVELPLDLVGTVDASEQWGARFRIRRGPLTGTLFGLNHTTLDLVDPEARQEIQEREFVDWSRAGGRLRQHLRLAHQLRRYGAADLEIEDTTLNFEQRGDLAKVWQWQLSGLGIQRQVDTGDGTGQATDAYRLRTQLYREVRGRDRFDLAGNFGLSQPRDAAAIETVGWSLFYRWRPRLNLEIAPFVSHARQASEDVEVTSPRAGIFLSWSRSAEAFDWGVGGRVSYGSLQRRDAATTLDEKTTGFSINASVGHGETKRLRKELEVEAGSNQLRSNQGEPITDLPDLGLPATVLGDEDYSRARVTLSHRWDSKTLSGWAQSSRRQASDAQGLQTYDSDTLTTTLQFNTRRLTITGHAGTTRVDQAARTDQEVRFVGTRARWRPWRALSLRASYRQDVRELALAPDIDGDRLELGLDLRVGQTVLLGSLFETNERIEDGNERTNRGLRWSISRRLAGWLPIVTGTQRRGVIR